MKDKSAITDELIEAVQANSKATSELENMRDAMKELAQLRAAGVAKGATALKPPHSGRYGEPPRSTRTTASDNRKKRA